MATKKKTLKKPATGTATAQPTAPAQDQASAQPDPTALSIGDLKNLATILDVASSRGAFKAAEMAGVGTLFNKLNAFLVNVEKGQQAGTDAKAPVEGK